MNIFEQIQPILEKAFEGNFDENLKRQVASKVLKDYGYSYKKITEGLKQIGINTSAPTLTRDIDKFEGYLMHRNSFGYQAGLYDKISEQLAQSLENPTTQATHEEIAMDNIPPHDNATAVPEEKEAFASPFADAPVIDRTITKKSAAFDDGEDEGVDSDDALLAGKEEVPEDVPEVKVADSFSYESAPASGTVGAELPPAQVKFTSDSLLDLLTFYTPKALCFFTNINVRQVENEVLLGVMPETHSIDDKPKKTIDIVKERNEQSKGAYQEVVNEYKPFLQKSILGVVSATKLNIKPEYMFIIHFIGFATQMQNVVREVNKSNAELLEQLRKEAKNN